VFRDVVGVVEGSLPNTPYQSRQLRDSLGVSFRFSRHGFHMTDVRVRLSVKIRKEKKRAKSQMSIKTNLSCADKRSSKEKGGVKRQDYAGLKKLHRNHV
jgi:hypothetical protein